MKNLLKRLKQPSGIFKQVARDNSVQIQVGTINTVKAHQCTCGEYAFKNTKSKSSS